MVEIFSGINRSVAGESHTRGKARFHAAERIVRANSAVKPAGVNPLALAALYPVIGADTIQVGHGAK